MRPDDGRVVSTFVTQALAGEPLTVQGSGDQTRSLCFVEDLVDGLVGLMESDLPGPVTSATTTSGRVSELARLIRDLAGSSSSIVTVAALPDDPAQRRPDLTLARERLGWMPTTPLDVGLTATLPGSPPSRRREPPDP